jgi:hypothetical protein
VKTLRFVMACGLVLALNATGTGDVESGPKAGDKVAALKAFGVVGTVEGKEADFAADRKELPTIYIFVSAMEGGIPVGGRPAARFMKVLDTEITKSVEKATIVAVWLGEKAFDKHKEYLPKINMSLNFENTSLAAFDGEKSGPKDWGVNPDAHLTVVVAHKGKVVKSFAFESVNETDVKPVLAELKKATEKK